MAARSAASEPTPENRSTPDRKRFALSSPSRPLDHRLNAARRDLADIALAGRWFAPHYAVPEQRTCGLNGSDIRSAAAPDAPRISQLLPGEDFALIEESGGWAWGYSVHDHYVGYVPGAALAEPIEATHMICRPTLAFAAPSSRAEVIAALPAGARIAGAVDGGFLETLSGYVPLQAVIAFGDLAVDPVAAAEMLAGTPYLWGGRGIGGIDCSGLVQVAFGLAAINLPRDSDQQAGVGCEAVGAGQRGDLLFFPEHVVLLTSPNQAVHASGHWMRVVVEPLADIIGRMGEPVARRRVLP